MLFEVEHTLLPENQRKILIVWIHIILPRKCIKERTAWHHLQDFGMIILFCYNKEY
jgi:hypothetical protein